jgi:hypothetical protein
VTHLVVELCTTPALIGIASLAARRFGQAIGGWFVALPLTSGPLLFFVALQHGHRFAAATAVGALGGGGSEVGFCLGYRLLAVRGRWPALAAGSLVYAGAAAAIRLLPLGPGLPLPLLPLLGGVLVAIAAGLAVLRAAGLEPGEPKLPSRWDVPLRMAAGTAIVVVLTEVAPALGPRLAGLIVTYPLLTAVLTVSAHRLDGPRGAGEVLRGLLLGLTGLVAFITAVAILLPRIGLAAFAVAVTAALVFQALSLRPARRATT